MLFVKFIFEQFLIHEITIFIMIVTNYTSFSNLFIRNFVLCIQIRFVSTEKTTRIASRASCVIYRNIESLLMF